ncbi:MAG: GGDEF domain-containing protein [Clostridia bacterium]|nr:GGDEF domain-containing protein [Clostridia bacterium]
MIDKILNFIKKFLSTSISDGCKFEYDLYINKINIVKAKITAITFIVLEVMMIVTHYITNKDKLFDVPYIYYGSMYITILLAMIAFLVIFTRLGTDVPQNIAGIRYAGVFFISFILMWCAGISLLDQLTSGQVIVYIVAIIATAITPLISPVALLLIYLLIHTLFLILMQYFQESAELLFMNSINTSTFVIMSWAISYMRYKKLIEEFNTRKIMQEKNEELNLINLQLQEANQKLEILSRTDSLTGVFNRLSFETRFEDEWSRCKRHSIPLSLIIVDIDFFKEFNDKYGHQAGDYCIKQIVGVLTACAKRSTDMVARLGGEEFVILLPHSNNENALKLAEQMRNGVEEAAVPHLYSDISDYVTISLGINTIIPSNESSIDEFINNADKALYKAKERRNCSVSAAQAILLICFLFF